MPGTLAGWTRAVESVLQRKSENPAAMATKKPRMGQGKTCTIVGLLDIT